MQYKYHGSQKSVLGQAIFGIFMKDWDDETNRNISYADNEKLKCFPNTWEDRMIFINQRNSLKKRLLHTIKTKYIITLSLETLNIYNEKYLSVINTKVERFFKKNHKLAMLL